MRNPLVFVVAFIAAILLSGCDQVEQALEDLNLPGSVEEAVDAVSGGDGPALPSRGGAAVSSVGTARALPSNSPTLSQARATGTVRIESGNTVFVAGYRQVSGNNQNPIIARYDNGRLTWSRTDYETGRADGRAYGLVYDPSRNVLYAAFSVDGGQAGSVGYERFTRSGWLTSYGRGGGAKASMIAQINPTSGAPMRGTFITSELTNGRTNTVVVTALSFPNASSLEVRANAWFHPRRTNGSRYTCSGSSPFRYKVVLNSNLTSAISASAPGCN